MSTDRPGANRNGPNFRFDHVLWLASIHHGRQRVNLVTRPPLVSSLFFSQMPIICCFARSSRPLSFTRRARQSIIGRRRLSIPRPWPSLRRCAPSLSTFIDRTRR